MRTGKVILMIICLLSMFNVYAQPCKYDLEINADTCYYILESHPRLYGFAAHKSCSHYGFKLLFKNENKKVVKESFPIFSSLRINSCGANAELVYLIKKGTEMTWYPIYLHLDDNMKFKFVYPVGCHPELPFVHNGFSLVHKGPLCGLVDSCGRYVFKLKYSDIYCSSMDGNEISVIEERCDRHERTIELKVQRYDSGITEKFNLWVPANCIQHATTHTRLEELYMDKYHQYALSDISDSGLPDPEKKELEMFHDALYNVMTHDIMKAFDIFGELSKSSDSGIRRGSRKNIKALNRYIRSSTLSFENTDNMTGRAGNAEDEDLDSGHCLATGMAGELYITDNEEFAADNSKFIVSRKCGKKISLYDKTGNEIKATLPVFDHVEVSKSEITAIQNVSIYDNYRIQIELVFDKNLTLKSAEAREIL